MACEVPKTFILVDWALPFPKLRVQPTCSAEKCRTSVVSNEFATLWAECLYFVRYRGVECKRRRTPIFRDAPSAKPLVQALARALELKIGTD